MQTTVKVCWSGGKDSSCAVMKHIEMGHAVKVVCYIPMLTETIPLITKQHHDFILQTAELFRRRGGAEVHIVTGRTYYDHVHYRSTRGKYKGRALGFPPFQRGWCTFKRDSKEKAIAQCDVGYFDYVDVGITADEKDRQNQLCESKRSILCELGITEADARAFCIRENILSPHYESQKRDGCALCPNANSKERQQWFIDYPEAVDIVVELQEFVKIERPGQYPLRQYKLFIEKGGKIN